MLECYEWVFPSLSITNLNNSTLQPVICSPCFLRTLLVSWCVIGIESKSASDKWSEGSVISLIFATSCLKCHFDCVAIRSMICQSSYTSHLPLAWLQMWAVRQHDVGKESVTMFAITLGLRAFDSSSCALFPTCTKGIFWDWPPSIATLQEGPLCEFSFCKCCLVRHPGPYAMAALLVSSAGMWAAFPTQHTPVLVYKDRLLWALTHISPSLSHLCHALFRCFNM